MGVNIAKQLAEKLRTESGGATMGVILLDEMVKQGIKHIASGASPILLKRGLDKARDDALNAIDKLATAVKTDEEVKNIATVSASGDTAIGEMIVEGMQKVGRTGVIIVEEAKGIESSIELIEGMQFDRGYLSAHFCTNADKMIVEMNGASILLIDKKISNIHELLPILQASAASGKPLLIVADDIEGDVLSTLVVNKMQGRLKVAAVKAPGFGDRKKEMLQDIAALTGATVISEDLGMKLQESGPENFGNVEKITITKDDTTLVCSGNEDAVQGRLKQIEQQLENSENTYDKEKLEERKARLTSGIAALRIGAATEPELKTRKQILEQSLHSTKAAIESGTVPGGGVALLHAADSLNELSGDENLGMQAFKKALEAIIKQLAENSGLDGSVILSEVREKGKNYGFNANSEKVEDLIKAGVVDPAGVIKEIIIQACSAAGLVLISEALILDAEADES